MKNVLIMGDSYSTYEGYIPEGYHFYYSDERENPPIVKGVEKTWWQMLAKENALSIVCNDSYSGSTICNKVRETLPVESSFINRMDNYIAKNFFEENNVDTMLIFGGTNDSWIDTPAGNLKYSDWSDDELKLVLPAFCYLLCRAKETVKNVVVILNCDLREEITEGMAKACDETNTKYVRLADIDKEFGHPTELGMKQITAQVAQCLNAD